MNDQDVDALVLASQRQWELETTAQILQPYGHLKYWMAERGVVPYKPNDPDHVMYGSRLCGAVQMPRTAYGCHSGTCFQCQLQSKPTHEAQLFIGVWTILGWVAFYVVAWWLHALP